MPALSLKLRFFTVVLASVCCLPSNWVGAEPHPPSDAIDTQSHPSFEAADYHHTRINTVDPVKSMQFYETVFNAQRIAYRGHSNAVLVDRALILFNPVSLPPPWKLESSLYHIGWGCKDAVAEFQWLKKHNVEVETPPEFQGSLVGDLNSRRGIIHGTENRENYSVIRAEVPLACMFGYATIIRSLSKGMATFTMEMSRYARVPQSIAEEIIERRRKLREESTKK